MRNVTGKCIAYCACATARQYVALTDDDNDIPFEKALEGETGGEG